MASILSSLFSKTSTAASISSRPTFIFSGLAFAFLDWPLFVLTGLHYCHQLLVVNVYLGLVNIHPGSESTSKDLKHRSSVAVQLLWNCYLPVCWRSRYLTTDVAYSLISQSLPRNGSACHNTYCVFALIYESFDL
jgi:hypothetical protein